MRTVPGIRRTLPGGCADAFDSTGLSFGWKRQLSGPLSLDPIYASLPSLEDIIRKERQANL
jgi:hypothetical protein